MRKNHKKALGLFGLATVVGMTAVAANLPAPAGAVSGVTDVISVTVVDNTTPAASIINIADGTVFTDPTVDIAVDYLNLKNLTITLQWGSASAKSRSSDSGTAVLSTDNFSYAERNGTKNLTINLDDYGGYNRYSLFVEGDGYITGAIPGDSVNFRYSGVSIDGIGTDTDSDGNIIGSDIEVAPGSGDPILDLQSSDETVKVIIDVYSQDPYQLVIDGFEAPANGKVQLPFLENKLPTGYYIIVLTGKNSQGQDTGTPIKILYYYEAPTDGNDSIKKDQNGNPVVHVDQPGEGGHSTINVFDGDGNTLIDPIDTTTGGDITLPFVENNIGMGDVVIEIVEYDANGNIVSVKRITYYYVPGVPKTGSLLAQLDISHSDYLTTSLVIFGIALIAAAVIFHKRKNGHRR